VTRSRPNVVLIVADDLGFSDLGCYGGEIRTPNLDRLGRAGVRFSQFYTTARCSPSRASLLTGLHPHQTGIGVLTNDDRPDGYPGTLNDRCVTVAEVLREHGYATCLAGKWHLVSQMDTVNDAWPTRRGFDRFFGTITGCGSFYTPGTLTRGESDASKEADDPDFFYTDAIATEAVSFIDDQAARPEQPLFLYTAFTAPHWPLHAPEADIRRYDGVFDDGWDVLRERRLTRLVEEGILPADTTLSDRDPTQPAWADADHKEWEVQRMQAYAAQVERMDRGVGRILDALVRTGRRDDTIVIFLSDNGASPEELPKIDEESFRQRTDILPPRTRDGRQLRVGNTPDIVPGAEDTYASYGQAWANLSNTPLRLYKRWVHEGGIAAPFILHWHSGGLPAGTVEHRPAQLTDVLPTLLEATGADYPDSFRGRPIPPPEGRSMLAALRGEPTTERTLYWEHTGNCAIRQGRWKLVREYPHRWELYDMTADRTELVDVAAVHPDIVERLGTAWQEWADRVGVLPWEATLNIYRARGRTDEEAAG
jgi:arylsulfatase A-like enzyme